MLHRIDVVDEDNRL